MGWLRYSSTVLWNRRVAISVDNSGAPAAVALDVDITIPKDFEDFWTSIDNAGDKIRVTGPDGVTAVAYDIDNGSGGSFDATAIANRTGRIRVDGMTIPTGTAGVFLLWLYYYPSGSVTDGSSAVTMASIGSGYIELDEPGGDYVTEYRPQLPRATNPRDIRHKGPTERVVVWIRLDRGLALQPRPSGGSRRREEPYYHAMSVVDDAAADQTAMYELGSNRFVWVGRGGRGSMWLRCVVKAGTSGDLYTLLATVHTVMPFAPTVIAQTFRPRMGLAVRETHL